MLAKAFKFLSAIHAFAIVAISRCMQLFKLPSHHLGDPSADPSSDRPSPPFGEINADVMVTEDDEVNQMVIEHMLKMLGYHSEIAKDGEEALRKVEEGRYGMILMDGQMPRMNGITTTREIRRWESITGAPATPIFALTADVVQGTREECWAAGMNGYLRKPITLAQLQSAVESQIGPPKTTRPKATTPIAAPHYGLDYRTLDYRTKKTPA